MAKRGRPAGSGSTVDLTVRVCKRGHVGNWVEREGTSPACRGCQDLAQREYRVRQGRRMSVPTARRALADLKVEQERLTNELATVMMKIAIQEVKLAVEELKAEVK